MSNRMKFIFTQNYNKGIIQSRRISHRALRSVRPSAKGLLSVIANVVGTITGTSRRKEEALAQLQELSDNIDKIDVILDEILEHSLKFVESLGNAYSSKDALSKSLGGINKKNLRLLMSDKADYLTGWRQNIRNTILNNILPLDKSLVIQLFTTLEEQLAMMESEIVQTKKSLQKQLKKRAAAASISGDISSDAILADTNEAIARIRETSKKISRMKNML